MEKKILKEEVEYLKDTLNIVDLKLNSLEKDSQSLEGDFQDSNAEYLEYLKQNPEKNFSLEIPKHELAREFKNYIENFSIENYGRNRFKVKIV